MQDKFIVGLGIFDKTMKHYSDKVMSASSLIKSLRFSVNQNRIMNLERLLLWMEYEQAAHF